MSDLSMHGLALLPIEGEAPPPRRDAREPFAWPTPPFAAYPAATCQIEAELCEIEGPKGNITHGRMTFFDPVEGLVQVQVPPARGVLPLRLSQFRRLTLLRPIAPPTPVGNASANEGAAVLIDPAQLSSCRLEFRCGGLALLDTVGHVDHPAGVFLFPPTELNGRVLRSFYPRASLAKVEMGARISAAPVEPPPPLTSLTRLAASATPSPTPIPTPKPTAAAAPAPVELALTDPQQRRKRRLGDMLLSERIVTPQQLLEAIERQERMPLVRIGEALKALGFINDAQLADALQHQQSDRSLPLGELLVRKGIITRVDLQTALSRKMGYPVVDVDIFPVEPEAALKLQVALARRLPALPLMMRAGRLILALEDPSSRDLIDEVEFSSQCRVVPVLARAGTLGLAIERVYRQLGGEPGTVNFDGPLNSPQSAHNTPGAPDSDNTNKLLANLEQNQAESSGSDAPAIEQSDNSLVRLINSMIIEAQQTGVSDIHIECQPGTEKVRIRFRRDGALQPYIELPHTYRAALIGRLKIMCDLDISERRKPQDGKISFSRFMKGQRLELRVATIPTANGLEDVVMRLLTSAKNLPLGGMGLTPSVLNKLKAVVERPYGMVLCVGPTGSGKTTTLHAALAHINTPERKIWTAEDPVEITQPGLRQVQVNPKIDWTFAKALRAFLRADPDVVMVGEIRDHETAQVAVEASLTGHLVLSTLHTNSAPETVTRLLDMGMDPFSFADSLLAVMAQRLVRRLCPKCIESRPATGPEIQGLLQEYLNAYPDPDKRPSREVVLTTLQGESGSEGVLMQHSCRGCAHCADTGFSGRAGLHELMVVDRELRHLIQTSARSALLQVAAMSAGMRTLRQDGITKVLAGVTTIEEVRAISNN